MVNALLVHIVSEHLNPKIGRPNTKKKILKKKGKTVQKIKSICVKNM